MDTSETYIKMCGKAEEAQSQWARKIGDFALNVPYNNSTPLTYIVCGQTWGKDIWLPRQDQLQEMVGDYSFCLDLILECNAYDSYFFKFTSMEQLWLAFVMKEKYSKVWDGEQWL